MFKAISIGALFIAVGYMGHGEQDTASKLATSDLVNQMSVVCHQSHQVLDGGLENQCGALIDQVQAKGYEVLNNDQGYFWAEVK